MKRPFLFKALTFGLCASALILTSCETTESRISDHPDVFNSLSPRDQQLVRNSQIRTGMSQNGVWLAWGKPDQKVVGVMHGRQTETWIYVTYVPAYGYGYGYPYGPYGPWGWGGWGWGGGAVIHAHHGHSFVFVGSPYYDPFYYSYIPPSVPVPDRTVTFSGDRVVSFQFSKYH